MGGIILIGLYAISAMVLFAGVGTFFNLQPEPTQQIVQMILPAIIIVGIIAGVFGIMTIKSDNPEEPSDEKV